MHNYKIEKASIPGYLHYNNLENSKDNLIIEKKKDYIIGIIASGAKEGSNNEACAQLCSGIAKENIIKMIKLGKDWKIIQPEINLFFQELFKDENFSIGQKAEKEFVQNYCLFTLMGFVIHKDELTVFHTGDGLIRINEDIIVDQNTVSNYLFLDNYTKQENIVYQTLSLSTVKDLIIATRGIYAFKDKGYDLNNFFKQEFFKDDSLLKEYLIKEMQKGTLVDDTSLIILERKI